MFGLFVAGLSSFPAIFGPTAKIIDIITSYSKLITATREVQLTVALVLTGVAGYALWNKGYLSRLATTARKALPFEFPRNKWARLALVLVLLAGNLALINGIYEDVSFKRDVLEWLDGTTVNPP